MFSTEFEIAVFWVGSSVLAIFLMLGAMLLGLLGLRAMGRWRREQMLARWRPLFMGCLYEDVTNWPEKPGSAAPSVLDLWCHLHDTLGNDQKRLLEQAAVKAGLPRLASGLLPGASVRNSCLGVEVLGRLKQLAAWDDLIRLLVHPAAEVSSAAAIALGRIDARRAAPVLLPLLADGSRWQPVFGWAVAESLQGVEAGFSGEMISPRQLEMLDVMSADKSRQVLSEIFAAPKSDELLSAALRLSKTPSLLEKIRPYAGHPQWFVRVQAANAIGRLGGEADASFLLSLLGDASWWVRYRASGALVRLLGQDLASMEKIRGAQADPFARDMLRQVMAEIALRARKP